MGNRRTARPSPTIPITSVEERLAGALVPQYAQTGVRNSTDSGVFSNLSVSSSASINSLTVGSSAMILSLAVSSGFTIQSSALKSAAFQASSAFLGSSQNLADVQSSSAARFNLGLGTASTQAASFFIASSATAIDSVRIGLVTPTSGKFTDLTITGTATLTGFVASSGLVTGYIPALTSTGGSIKLAVMST